MIEKLSHAPAQNRPPLGLLLLRASVFLVMFVWTVDKFVEPQHASKIMEQFYLIGGVSRILVYLLAVIELAVILAFLFGCAKKWSYALVFLMHGVFMACGPEISFPLTIKRRNRKSHRDRQAPARRHHTRHVGLIQAH